jgi:nonsense-mediated mRNA decay protein 3
LFCVECGREDELIGSVCKECFSKKHAIVSLPDHVDLTLCAHCSSMETPKGWKDVGSMREAVEAAIRASLVLLKDAKVSDLRIELSEKDERNLQAEVSLLVTAGGAEFERSMSTIVRIKRGSCKECSKKQGNYYEAILQVRGPERNLPESTEEEVQRMVKERVASMRKTSREIFISKVERVKGGLDFFFSTIPAARNIAREIENSMCAEYKESSSLWGRRDGKDIYRMTYMVRFQGFSKGDVIEYGGKMYFVRGMAKGMIHGIDISTGEERSMHLQDPGECSLVQPKGKILNAVVVAETKDEIQVLDTDTMKTLDVRKPNGFSREGEQVRLVKTKAGTFVLSDSW